MDEFETFQPATTVELTEEQSRQLVRDTAEYVGALIGMPDLAGKVDAVLAPMYADVAAAHADHVHYRAA
ncbi:hypothetical protein IU449_27145 [Nocardia higoensis]|uniref:Uncharacterized protein n=1 Tax=Nocardia higoensis TaxID=228599 RepID=A0ABS0DI89_9NOCA|nr:hypothetical protein [Nocardia higoensis]MBF6358177.1 hypothetical protein [Nocardia higoensis]